MIWIIFIKIYKKLTSGSDSSESVKRSDFLPEAAEKDAKYWGQTDVPIEEQPRCRRKDNHEKIYLY